MASELQRAFPAILGARRLVQAWSYKYDEGHERGIDPHADAGAVSVNLWVTPDSANLDPASGGLLVWPEPPPEGWTFERANLDSSAVRDHLGRGARFMDRPTPYSEWAARRRAAEEGRGAAAASVDGRLEVLRVPHKANRCLIFESHLFHQTDTVRFKKGFTNRRINVTFLFQ